MIEILALCAIALLTVCLTASGSKHFDGTTGPSDGQVSPKGSVSPCPYKEDF